MNYAATAVQIAFNDFYRQLDTAQKARLDRFRPLTTCRSDTRCVGAGQQVAVTRQRPEREEFPVAVIAQIEHPRETGRGVARLVPEAVGGLRLQQITHAARHRRMVDLAGGHQTEQRPGGLRGGARGRLMAAIVELVARRRPRPSRRRRSGSIPASRPPCAISGDADRARRR